MASLSYKKADSLIAEVLDSIPPGKKRSGMLSQVIYAYRKGKKNKLRSCGAANGLILKYDIDKTDGLKLVTVDALSL